jgi:chromosomal replication initiator protein
VAEDLASPSMHDHWNEALQALRAQLSDESYDNWLAPIRYDGFEDGKLQLRIPNRFYADWFRARYQEELLELLKQKSGVRTIDLSWQVDETLIEPVAAVPNGAGRIELRPDAISESLPRVATNLNPKYRFETFVVGTSNQLAHAASVAVASSPGKRYNPLFIYGGVGLGKTHLVNAVGHRVLSDNPQARILYVSA